MNDKQAGEISIKTITIDEKTLRELIRQLIREELDVLLNDLTIVSMTEERIQNAIVEGIKEGFRL